MPPPRQPRGQPDDAMASPRADSDDSGHGRDTETQRSTLSDLSTVNIKRHTHAHVGFSLRLFFNNGAAHRKVHRTGATIAATHDTLGHHATERETYYDLTGGRRALRILTTNAAAKSSGHKHLRAQHLQKTPRLANTRARRYDAGHGNSDRMALRWHLRARTDGLVPTSAPARGDHYEHTAAAGTDAGWRGRGGRAGALRIRRVRPG